MTFLSCTLKQAPDTLYSLPLSLSFTHTHALTWASEDCRVLRNPGVWWVVVAGDRVCCTLRQIQSGSFPLERLLAVFSPHFFNIFDCFYYCLSDCFWLLANIHCLPLLSSVSPQMTGHPLRSTSSPYFIPFSPILSLLSCGGPWTIIMNEFWGWRALWLSPMKVHVFIIEAGKAVWSSGEQ